MSKNTISNAIPLIVLPPSEMVLQSDSGRYPASSQEILKPLVEGLLAPAGGGTSARIKQLIKHLEETLAPAETAEIPAPAHPEMEPGVLSDTYFGIARESSECPFDTQAKAALRAIHSALVDIDGNGSTLSEIEIGNLFKLPVALSLLATEVQVTEEVS